ncbi:MAG: hypothetical protein VX583_04085 [Bdellovibrionota bacterium]|nr:hypothetical protein [Pseudobdellovibrionaceae bacterium]|tara:strand:+ start:79139 stop:79342 length:204 start_codon:yes stop_codon:yes gene_type:complete
MTKKNTNYLLIGLVVYGLSFLLACSNPSTADTKKLSLKQENCASPALNQAGKLSLPDSDVSCSTEEH